MVETTKIAVLGEGGELTVEDAIGKQIILSELVEKQHFCCLL